MAKKILVVEDDPVGRKVLVDYLTAHGYEVATAANGPDGIAAAASERPDLVLCDVLLPKRSGFEVCFEVKRQPETRDVPVLLMSAVLSDPHSEFYAAVDLHADGYFVKPFMMSALLTRIRALLAA
jgi:DNA-binding response OmpR family regulator